MPTSVQTQAVGATTAPKTTTPSSTLGKDDFLKLLTTQLRYQDPLNPMEGTEFATQLAQFSSVEQLTNINSTLSQNLDAMYTLSQVVGNSMSASLIGNQVRATSDKFAYGGDGSVKLGYTLPEASDAVTVQVYNQNGALVRTFLNPGNASGDNTITWDGKDSLGNAVAAGNYTFKVDARDEKGTALKASQYIYGVVSGVRFKSDGTYFVVDGAEVSIGDILEIIKS